MVLVAPRLGGVVGVFYCDGVGVSAERLVEGLGQGKFDIGCVWDGCIIDRREFRAGVLGLMARRDAAAASTRTNGADVCSLCRELDGSYRYEWLDGSFLECGG